MCAARHFSLKGLEGVPILRGYAMKWILIMTVCLMSGAAWATNEVPAVPFQVGERLTYQIFWGPFVAGRATLHVAGMESVDGHDCYHLVAQARTSGLADMLYHIETTNESWLDAAELFTRRYRERRTEGKHIRAGETRYNYTTRQAWTTNFVTGKIKSYPLEAPVQDMISSLYFVRTKPLELDVDRTFLVNVSGSNYVVNVRPDLRKTMYFRPTGDVPALRLEPKPTLTIVSSNKGRMWFWVSDDLRRLPLLVASDLRIGTAKLVLNSIESSP